MKHQRPEKMHQLTHEICTTAGQKISLSELYINLMFHILGSAVIVKVSDLNENRNFPMFV